MAGGEPQRAVGDGSPSGFFQGRGSTGQDVSDLVGGQETGQRDRRQVQSQGAKSALPGGSTVAALSWGQEDKASATLRSMAPPGLFERGLSCLSPMYLFIHHHPVLISLGPTVPPA